MEPFRVHTTPLIASTMGLRSWFCSLSLTVTAEKGGLAPLLPTRSLIPSLFFSSSLFFLAFLFPGATTVIALRSDTVEVFNISPIFNSTGRQGLL